MVDSIEKGKVLSIEHFKELLKVYQKKDEYKKIKDYKIKILHDDSYEDTDAIKNFIEKLRKDRKEETKHKFYRNIILLFSMLIGFIIGRFVIRLLF